MEDNKKRCTKCGYLNEGDYKYCKQCGSPLNSFFTNEDFNDNFGKNNGADFIAGDINEEKYAAMVGDRRKVYYLSRFKKLEQEKTKFGLNFSVLLATVFSPIFMGVWFIYRRMYKIGILLTVAVLLLFGVKTFLTYDYEYYVGYKLCVQKFTSIGTTDAEKAKGEKQAQKYEKFIEKESDKSVKVSNIYLLTVWFGAVFLAIFATYIYKRHCDKIITKLTSDCRNSRDDYIIAGAPKVGVAVVFAIATVLVYTAIGMVPFAGALKDYLSVVNISHASSVGSAVSNVINI